MFEDIDLKILNYKKSSNGKDKVGEVQVRIKLPKETVLVLNKLHHVSKPHGEWVNYPGNPEVNEQGKRKFVQFMEFEDKNLENRIRGIVMEKLNEYFENNQIPLFESISYVEENLPF